MNHLIKSLTFSFALLLISPTILSQSLTEEVDLMQSIYGMEKKTVISEFLGDSVNDSFWEVYDAYETERKQLGKDRIALLNEYVENYSKLEGEKADDMVKKAEKLNSSQTKLISQYTKRVRKVAGSKVAAQFYQIEHYLLGITRTEIFENIPFIGDLKSN